VDSMIGGVAELSSSFDKTGASSAGCCSPKSGNFSAQKLRLYESQKTFVSTP